MNLKVKQSNLKTEKKPEQLMKMALAACMVVLIDNQDTKTSLSKYSQV